MAAAAAGWPRRAPPAAGGTGYGVAPGRSRARPPRPAGTGRRLRHQDAGAAAESVPARAAAGTGTWQPPRAGQQARRDRPARRRRGDNAARRRRPGAGPGPGGPRPPQKPPETPGRRPWRPAPRPESEHALGGADDAARGQPTAAGLRCRASGRARSAAGSRAGPGTPGRRVAAAAAGARREARDAGHAVDPGPTLPPMRWRPARGGPEPGRPVTAREPGSGRLPAGEHGRGPGAGAQRPGLPRSQADQDDHPAVPRDRG